MSFGGAVQGMITSIKNNRNLLSKRKPLKEMMGGLSKGKKPLRFKSADASPYELHKLKTELQEERKEVLIKQYTVLVLFLIILISVLYCYA